MVSIGPSAVDRSAVKSAEIPSLGNAIAIDAVLGKTVSQCSIPAIQLGSVGALVALGVLGSASGAQAMVRRGAQCEAVEQLQATLSDRGYDVGTLDGKFGGRTEAAVRRFQQQQQLQSDGIVGPATARAMGLPPEFSCSVAAAQAVHEPVAWSPDGEFAVTTNGGVLRLRKAPAGPVVGALKNGDRVTVIGIKDDWARLSSGAWVSRAWLQVGRRAKDATPQNQSIAQAVPSADASSTEIAIATAIPGQVIQLPSPESSQSTPQVAVESKVVAALPKTGKISVSLPKAEPAAGTPVALVVDKVVASDMAVMQAGVEPGVAVTAPTPIQNSVNKVSAPSLGLEPGQINSRALLVAAASDSISLPSAIAPESTPLAAVDSPRVVDPAAALAPVEAAVEVAEPTLIEPLVSEVELQPEARLPVEAPAVVAVRSSSQSMEVSTYGDRLLIRETPGGQVIGSIPNGLTIRTVSQEDGWYELETGGWVMARWLRS